MDTSVWLATTAGAFDAVGNRTVVVSSLVLAELRSAERRQGRPGDTASDVAETAWVEAPGIADALAGGSLHAELRRRGLNVSLVAAIQLATARRLGIPLLTRDRAFPNEPDVEYV